MIQTDKVQAIRVLDFPGCPFDPARRDRPDQPGQIANPWPQFRHDARNTGYLATPIVTPVQTLNLEGRRRRGRVEIRWRTEAIPTFLRRCAVKGSTGTWESLGQWTAAELSTGDGAYLLRDQVPAEGGVALPYRGARRAGAGRSSGEVTVNVGAPAVSASIRRGRTRSTRGR